MASTVTTPAGTVLPRLIYGTAWKGADTADRVYAALRAGFRAVDTAAQPKHYREDLVAEGVRRALADGTVSSRSELYLQTKFTPLASQDPDTPPYDPSQPLAEQVRQSVEASLRLFSFATEPSPAYLDCVVLHAPLPTPAATLAVWATLEAFVPHRVRSLGISNVTAADLAALPAVAASAAVVQNRFHGRDPDPAARYDGAVRRFCASAGPSSPPIVYQAFWTLTANAKLLRRSPAVRAVAAGAAVAPEVALYALITLGLDSLGPIVVLDGTSSPDHMAADLAGLAHVEAWARGDGAAAWRAAADAFRHVVGDDAGDDADERERD